MSSTSIANNIQGIVAPMTGATSGVAGTAGSVPAPAAGKQTAFLRGDGTFAAATTVSTGDPEAVVTGNPGDTYWDTTANILYIKETGTNTNTGWTQGPPATDIQGASGYFDIGNVRVQWGKTASVGDNDQTITFPFAFASAPTVTCNTELTTGTNASFGTGLKSITTTTFLANRDDTIADADGPFFNWIAIGLI